MKRSTLILLSGLVACSPGTTLTTDSRATPAAALPTTDAPQVGLLVMAHGGTPEWNESVMDAVEPSSEHVPTAVAFGMANPYTLQSGLDELHAQGVTRVAVVRMFLSGESFLDQTEYFLGVSDEQPEHFVLMGPAAADPEARTPVTHTMEIATHAAGILDSHYVGSIMADRARALSADPANEAVLLIAHGMGDETQNDRVLASMRRASSQLTAEGYSDVEIATLREDWEEKRVEAESDIRDYVRSRADDHAVLVLPMRLSGFGPYADVLDGLEYAAGDGLLPHADIGSWVLSTANGVTCASGWGSITGECPNVTADLTPHQPARD